MKSRVLSLLITEIMTPLNYLSGAAESRWKETLYSLARNGLGRNYYCPKRALKIT